jgi:hypothetical protein
MQVFLISVYFRPFPRTVAYVSFIIFNLLRVTPVDCKSLIQFDRFQLNLLVTVMGWYSTKRLMHCDHCLIYCASQSEF